MIDPRPTVSLGAAPLRLEDVWALATGERRPALSDDAAVLGRLEKGAAMIERALAEGNRIYGVTTGYGASAGHEVDPLIADVLPLNLLRYHGCGTGRLLSETESAAVVAVRAASLARGYSGVRRTLVERLCTLVERRILPAIPEEGSVGASGDLTPLSYVAALVVGEREALVEGRVEDAATALANAGLTPLALRPKEALAIMNGTAMMAALGALAWNRARRLASLAAQLTALASDVLDGPEGHFVDRLFALKPHRGQRLAAAWIRGSLSPRTMPPARIQDPYSLRCAPHVIGVLVDALSFTRQLVETEIHGVDDNPLIDPETERVYHGGHFYGGHACLATDVLKNVVANVAELCERQLVLLNDPDTNAGLPPNLVARRGDDRFTHHGFKAMEITASALVAEALKTAAPASVFSRSTESHNQDKVSMGALSAREARRVCDLAETVASIHLLALCQAADIRGLDRLGAPARALVDSVRAVVPRNDGDRRMDRDIDAVLQLLRRDALPGVDAETAPEGESSWP